MTKVMSSTKTNIIANFAGKAWTGIINLAFVPLYIKFLGIEAYGLIGFFVSLLALLSILDMGLSTTLNRELARLVVLPNREQEARNLTRTFEVIYWGTGLLIGLIVVILAPVISRKWVQAQGIPPDTVEHALMMMGFIIAIQWPCSLYSGGLAGLQQQVLMNGLRSAVGTVQAVGAILVLWFISPTIYAYFNWQFAISIVQTLVFAYSLWRSLPKSAERPVFDGALLITNFHFALGMTGISIVVTVLTQMDKIVLSKILPLEYFGYYMLAVTVGLTINYLVLPVSAALFPKFVQLIGTRDEAGLSAIYHKGCQVTSVIVIPAAITFFFYSEEILKLWLRNSTTVHNVNMIAKLMVIGSCLNALMTLPYNLQLAYGWTRLAFLQNLVSVVLLAPFLIIMVKHFGVVGAAVVWVILNGSYLIILIPVMHKRLLQADMRQWYLVDVGIPALAALSSSFLFRITMPTNVGQYATLSWIALSSIVSFLFAMFCTPAVSIWMKTKLSFR